MNELRISVIICSIEAIKYARICENYRRLLANIPYEIIGIHDAKSLGEGYNRGIEQAKGDILIFSHDDILILDDHFAEKIIARLSSFDLLGFAGASRLVNGKWTGVSNQFLHGAIAHALPKSNTLTLNVYGIDEWPVAPNIKVIDGLCMIVKRQIAANIGFDATTFDGFHLYDLDFSFSCYLNGLNIGVCCDIPIIHESGGNFDNKYRDYAKRFENKYGEHLDPPELGRPGGMRLCSAVSQKDPDALIASWQKDSLKCFALNLASETAYEQSQANIGAKYHDWLAQRGFIESDTKFLAPISTQSFTLSPPPRFHLFIRLQTGFESKLADTIDSLAQQINDEWLLDIISVQPSPDGIEEISNLRWLTIAETNDSKQIIDLLVEASPCEWIVEIPPGARLDILYLNRLNFEAISLPDVAAFYVDDDCCDSEGNRHSPRFKPRTNSYHLQSSDLAGPLCVRKEVWLNSGGAGSTTESPWFSQLLSISNTFGWGAIQHIPDILLTYPDRFPSTPETCRTSLIASLKEKGVDADVHYVTPDSWYVRHHAKDLPPITLAILSQGQLEFIIRCVNSILGFTNYHHFEIIIVTNSIPGDPDFYTWLKDTQNKSNAISIRSIFVAHDANHATRCNAAMAAANHELVVLLREEIALVQNSWLDELARVFEDKTVAAASPLIHLAGNANILSSGGVFGLLGEYASPHAGAALGDTGYLDALKVTREVATLPSACMLIRKSAFEKAGGMDAERLGEYCAEIDLALKLREHAYRIIVHPRSGVVFGGETSEYDLGRRLTSLKNKREASHSLRQRWGDKVLQDPYWNPSLSLSDASPQPETEFRAQWQYLPTNRPRILAHPLGNGQGDFRVTSPLTAVRKAGLAMECVWRQKISSMARYFTAAEIAQLAPTTVIIQNYIHDIALAALDDWRASSDRPFIVYTLDDLINDLDVTNPFRKHIPPNSRSRFKYALERCDRLVLSTEYLAETYRHFISDIQVVPNRLEKDVWLPLVSERRTAPKPRVGWAGGTTHQGDLILLKEIIEQTRNEVDWIFFGMCPDELRPLIAEYHDLVSFDEYPAHLAMLNLDIAVAPLAITDFNRGKSNLRLLEYGALGIPVVCTDIDPYQNSPACRVQNKARDWVNALRERINDPEAREREGNAMRDWVYRHFLLEDHLDQWLAAHLPG